MDEYREVSLSPSVESSRMETTGRFLVLLAEDAADEGVKLLTKSTGPRFMSTAETEIGALDAETLESGATLFFDKLNIAVVSAEPVQLQALSSARTEGGPILAIEP